MQLVKDSPRRSPWLVRLGIALVLALVLAGVAVFLASSRAATKRVVNVQAAPSSAARLSANDVSFAVFSKPADELPADFAKARLPDPIDPAVGARLVATNGELTAYLTKTVNGDYCLLAAFQAAQPPDATCTNADAIASKGIALLGKRSSAGDAFNGVGVAPDFVQAVTDSGVNVPVSDNAFVVSAKAGDAIVADTPDGLLTTTIAFPSSDSVTTVPPSLGSSGR